MKEGTSGKYTLETVAPKKAADYDVSVRIKSPLGQSLAKDNVLKLTTIEPTSSFEEVKLTTLGKRVTFNFGVKNPPADLEKFKIAYGENPESFSNEVMTWNTGKILKADGRYEWYIDNLTPKNYSFKIMGVRKDGTIFDAMVSETLSTTIGSSASCTI